MKFFFSLQLLWLLLLHAYAQEAHTDCNLRGPVSTVFFSATDPVIDGTASVVFRVQAHGSFLLKRSSLVVHSGYSKPGGVEIGLAAGCYAVVVRGNLHTYSHLWIKTN